LLATKPFSVLPKASPHVMMSISHELKGLTKVPEDQGQDLDKKIDELNRIPEQDKKRGIRIRWNSDSVSDMATILNLITSVTEVIRRTLDSIHNAVYQDLHLVAHLLGPVRKIKTSDLPSGGKGYPAWEVRPQ
ncbi:hypothetical protein TNIN_204041, partial [Trichonephila inaurata madagascariensis]